MGLFHISQMRGTRGLGDLGFVPIEAERRTHKSRNHALRFFIGSRESPATNDFDIVRFCKRSVYERRLCEQIVSEQRESHSLVTALARLEKLGKS